MIRTRSSYILGETGISVAINTLLSLAFVFAAFHGRTQIPVLGSRGIVPDMAPQTFMVTIMSCLVPGLLTRRRGQQGLLVWHGTATRDTPGRVVLFACMLAVATTVPIVALCWAALPALLPDGVRFTPLLVSKAVFGAVLAAAVTPVAIARALRA